MLQRQSVSCNGRESGRTIGNSSSNDSGSSNDSCSSNDSGNINVSCSTTDIGIDIQTGSDRSGRGSCKGKDIGSVKSNVATVADAEALALA
jgi:hypothetical protein